MADALNNLAPVPMMTGDLRLARRFAAQARDMWQGLGDPWQAALATLALGMSSLLEGAYAQALTYFEEFLPVVRARRPLLAHQWLDEHGPGAALPGPIRAGPREFR
jgi:hypothetical protein